MIRMTVNSPPRQPALLPDSELQPWLCCKCWAGGSTRRYVAGRRAGPAYRLSPGTARHKDDALVNVVRSFVPIVYEWTGDAWIFTAGGRLRWIQFATSNVGWHFSSLISMVLYRHTDLTLGRWLGGRMTPKIDTGSGTMLTAKTINSKHPRG